MYSNGVNSYTPIKEDAFKPKMDSQNFNFDGEAFSDLMDKEEASGNGLRETAKEIAEDEAILSTDEENRAMIKKRQNPTENQKVVPNGQEDKTRLLKLMDMSNKINFNSINISKSKKELENTVGSGQNDVDEPEDITSVISKLMANKEAESDSDEPKADVQSSLDLNDHLKNLYQDRKDNSQVLHETEEELAEDESILSTEEENLEMARRNIEKNRLSDEEYKTTEEDMLFMNEIVALNNQVHIEKSESKEKTNSIINALMSQTMNVTNHNKIDLSELNKADVDCIVGLLRRGTQDSSSFTDENNDELDNLSRKFLALLKDSIINNKVFRIDFDKDISVIIKINKDGQLNVELQTTDEKLALHIKENLHILKEKFEALNVKYDKISLKETK